MVKRRFKIVTTVARERKKRLVINPIIISRLMGMKYIEPKPNWVANPSLIENKQIDIKRVFSSSKLICEGNYPNRDEMWLDFSELCLLDTKTYEERSKFCG
mgnify:CR=1 FL=1